MKNCTALLLAACSILFLFSCLQKPENKISPEKEAIEKKIDSLKKRILINDSIKNSYRLKRSKKRTKSKELDTMQSKTI